jgi:adenylate cyclase
MSGDPEQEYFSDGISEDIITDLSKIAGLTVIARNSSFTYKGRAVDIRTVGRDLSVRSVLEGSIRRILYAYFAAILKTNVHPIADALMDD